VVEAPPRTTAPDRAPGPRPRTTDATGRRPLRLIDAAACHRRPTAIHGPPDATYDATAYADDADDATAYDAYAYAYDAYDAYDAYAYDAYDGAITRQPL
jgi:hypothetical protein